jgi:hypothetical protein
MLPIVITVDDPLETWLPTRLLRMAYRPFETKVQGTDGFSKWGIRLGFVAPRYARHWAKAWHEEDLAFVYQLPLAA